MYISMCGCGVGYSVENHIVQQLPIIQKQSGEIVEDIVIDKFDIVSQ